MREHVYQHGSRPDERSRARSLTVRRGCQSSKERVARCGRASSQKRYEPDVPVNRLCSADAATARSTLINSVQANAMTDIQSTDSCTSSIIMRRRSRRNSSKDRNSYTLRGMDSGQRTTRLYGGTSGLEPALITSFLKAVMVFIRPKLIAGNAWGVACG